MLVAGALLMLSPSAAYGPTVPAPQVKAKATADPCQDEKIEPDVVVVCGKRESFRIDPDLLKAQRLYRNRSKPKPPERFVDTTCRVVGTMGCMNAPQINLLAAAATAVNILKTAASGGNVGKLLTTEPTPTEYELYKAIKKEREERDFLEGRAPATPSSKVARTEGSGE